MAKLRLGMAALVVATLAACTGAPIDFPTLSPVATTPAATTPAATTPAATTPAATTPAATTPAATTPAASTPPAVSPTPTMSPAEAWAMLYAAHCVRVRHQSLGTFISYLEWGIGVNEDFAQDADDLIDYIEITVIGANDDEPEELIYDANTGWFFGLLGLRGTGEKTIVNVRIHWNDGSVTDVTEDMIEEFGSDTFEVRFPEEDEFGDCENAPEP